MGICRRLLVTVSSSSFFLSLFFAFFFFYLPPAILDGWTSLSVKRKPVGGYFFMSTSVLGVDLSFLFSRFKRDPVKTLGKKNMDKINRRG